jgi:putative transposase
MISASDRQRAVELIDNARAEGARLERACRVLELTARTYQRWVGEGQGVAADRRPGATRPKPARALSEQERETVRELMHEERFASMPPAQVVAVLADEGRYLASESTIYRVLREADEQHHRGRAKAPGKAAAPTTHIAHGPCEVWSWDVTWLPGPAKGLFYYLYIILDLYSRKIVGWEVYESETAEHSATVIQRAVWNERLSDKPSLVLHSDNGSPFKAATLRETLVKLQVTSSYSRPRVSNDNAYSEALFRTCKYRPSYPERGFADLESARAWVADFVHWYNHEHRHSAICFVTPSQRHNGEDKAILANRLVVYTQAQAEKPERWSGKIRNWEPVGAVALNPEKPAAKKAVA